MGRDGGVDDGGGGVEWSDAQTTHVVTNQIRCATCELGVERVASLGKLDAPEFIGESTWIVQRTSDGRFLVPGSLLSTNILIVDSTGTYLTAWGREGEGPGEFRSITMLLLLPGDSLLVVDRYSRLQLLDPDGQSVRSANLGFHQLLGLDVLPTGQIVASATLHTPEGIGRPIHIEVNGSVDPRQERPMPWFQDLYEDDDGYIWVLVRIAAEDWRPSTERVHAPGWGKYHDSIVEVIDPRSSELLASRRFPWYGHGFTPDGLVVSRREGEAGIMVVDVWRVTLNGAAAPPRTASRSRSPARSR